MAEARIDFSSAMGAGGTSAGSAAQLAAQMAKMNEAAAKRRGAVESKINLAIARGDIAEKRKLEAQLRKEKERENKIMAKRQSEYEKQLNKEEIEEYEKLFGKSIDKTLKDAGKKLASNIGTALAGSVDKYLGTYARYMTQINARIQGAGAGFDYESINKTIKNNIALNPYIKYTDMLDKLSRLVEEGIADNLVQRAFLATISDKIATTFNAAQGSLLEIIRIQQRDSTAARLGMEAELTQLFNHYFSDTSYLSNTFDSVQAYLIDLSSTLDEKTSVEFEYMVQKWLGSLGSVGVSSSTLSSIAQGINYLGTGNVTALSSNQSLQNLLVMAANRANLSYSGMLSGGMNASEANLLLASLIQYVQEIAGSSNNVVKQQYAQLFGLTMSDMRAFTNISDTVINELYKSGMTYADTLSELNDQMGQIGSRMHLSEMINNVLDNVLAATGIGIANNPAMYGIYKAADMLESITGGIYLPPIPIPFVGDISPKQSVESIIKNTIIGIGTIPALFGAIGNIFKGDGVLGSFDLESGLNSIWNVSLNKGGFSTYLNAGDVSTRKTAVNYMSSGSGLGIQQSLLDESQEAANMISGEQSEDEDTSSPIYWLKIITNYLTSDNATNPLNVKIQNIDLYGSNLPL